MNALVGPKGRFERIEPDDPRFGDLPRKNAVTIEPGFRILDAGDDLYEFRVAIAECIEHGVRAVLLAPRNLELHVREHSRAARRLNCFVKRVKYAIIDAYERARSALLDAVDKDSRWLQIVALVALSLFFYAIIAR